MIARQATPEDVAELVRLRAVMLDVRPGDDDWRDQARQVLAKRLAEAEPTMVAFVVDRPGGGLASCAVGTIDQRLASPSNPGGRSGYVSNVATDPDVRRRGYSRACLTALIEWFGARGIVRVDLRASPEGEPLYRSLGFVRTGDPAMRLRLPPPGPHGEGLA